MTWQTHGEVFTRRWVAEALLDLTGYTAEADLGAMHLVEPSVGSGAFLGPAVDRLIESAKAFGRDLSTLGDAILGFDLQEPHVQASRDLCTRLLVDGGLDDDTARSISHNWIRVGDYLLEPESRKADVVVGNPPYIRYDEIPSDVAASYRQRWVTMRGRGDIFVGFYEKGLATLKPGARLGFICADRWMRNSYGADLRGLIASRYAVEHVWAMHDVDAFEAEVSAYPAITVLANLPQGSAVVADTTASFCESTAQALIKWSTDDSLTDFSDTGVQAHRLPAWFAGDDMWPTGSPTRLALIEHLTEAFGPLHDPATGTKVSIGVATGADKAFITKDQNAAEPDRMLPLAMRRDLMSGRFDWQGNYLVNPWDDDGNLVDLDDYPRLAEYLGAHPAVKGRFVAKKNPAKWYKTIDKVHASLTPKPKLLLQDMKAHIHPVLEPGGFYPHHNLYYVTSDEWDMEVLGGLLLSRVAQAFIEAYCVRMRGGTLRFQAQYLKKIRVPSPEAVTPFVAEALRAAFRNRDVDAATEAAAEAYQIDCGAYDL